jgi:hypothetical protein
VIACVKDRADDLSLANWICPAIPVPLKHDRRALIGFDYGSEVGPKRPIAAPLRVVRSPEPSADLAFDASISEKEVLLPLAAEADGPSLWIGEADR